MKAQIPGRDRGSLGTQNVLYLDPYGNVIDVTIDRKSSSEFIKLCTLNKTVFPSRENNPKIRKRSIARKVRQDVDIRVGYMRAFYDSLHFGVFEVFQNKK